jgi:hypothetical protein
VIESRSCNLHEIDLAPYEAFKSYPGNFKYTIAEEDLDVDSGDEIEETELLGDFHRAMDDFDPEETTLTLNRVRTSSLIWLGEPRTRMASMISSLVQTTIASSMAVVVTAM